MKLGQARKIKEETEAQTDAVVPTSLYGLGLRVKCETVSLVSSHLPWGGAHAPCLPLQCTLPPSLTLYRCLIPGRSMYTLGADSLALSRYLSLSFTAQSLSVFLSLPRSRSH